jgi:hypothetical protein
VEFRPAKGGITSETHMKFKRGGQGGGPSEDHETETAIHPTMDHAHAHLTAMLGHCMANQKAEAKEAESGKEE